MFINCPRPRRRWAFPHAGSATWDAWTHRYATHFASAPFSAPVADFRGGNYATHYQAVMAAQSLGPGGVGSVGYVEVAGHELLFYRDVGVAFVGERYSAISIMSKYINRVCSSSSFFVSCRNPFFS